ncbi:recombinase family protein [Salana multivorans]
MGTKAAIYLRTSLDHTGEELAVRRHREDCHRIARERGWEVAEEYVDNSISSKKGVTRPAYDRMRADYLAGRFDALLCWDLDRLMRVPRQLEDWIDAAEATGFPVVTANR